MAARNDAGPSPLEWLLGELDRMDGCQTTKGRVRGLLRNMVGQRIYLSRAALVRPDLVASARQMIEKGATASEARASLAARGEFSRRTAERLVAQALNERARQIMRERQMTLDLDEVEHGHHQ